MRPPRLTLCGQLLRLLIAIALTGLLSACGQLPRPFQPEGKAVDLRALAERQTLYVLPASGVGPSGGDFAEALATALEAQGLRATTSGAPGNRVISTSGRLDPMGGQAQLALIADVSEPDGTPLVSTLSEQRVPTGAWEASDRELLAAVADALAADLARQLAPAPIEQVALPGFPGARVVVLPISGAPGDGADSLPTALRAELEDRDVPLARDPEPQDLLIAGRVEVQPDGPGAERATITWRLLEAAAPADRGAAAGATDSETEQEIGQEIGRVAQSNRIPAGQLDGRWGQIARQVADYAADGLLQLIEQAAGGRP
ncbi:hypothetical protein [Algihabitans albus]|uniref:hypothetical protein n=1 Tax=Algihabitans albus TaxID=2164067 RepID=UPI000E5C5933|nr:hypothetical protein [Algihabitans albus]